MTSAGPWPTVRLGDVASVSRGASPRPIASSRWFSDSSNVGWVRISDLGRSKGSVLRTTTQKLSPDGVARSRFLPPGTLIMSIAATVGVPIITGIPACIHDGFVAIEKLKGVNQQYLLYVLRASEGVLKASGQTGSQANINTDIVNNLEFSLPDEQEQASIARALQDADQLVITLDQLIAKKAAIKQGTMRELLTGNTRLPGFEVKSGFNETSDGRIPADWRISELRKVSTMHGRIGWQGLKQSEFTSNPTDPYLITGMNFKEGEITWADVYHVPRDRYDLAPDIQLRADDVLMTKDGTIGKLLYVRNIPSPGLATLNSHLLVFRPKNNSYVPRYLYYQLASRRFLDHIELNKSGSTFYGLSQGATGKYKMVLPPIDEQRAIAEVLSSIDADISKLESRRNKAVAIKNGMMQELLSGRTRLILEEVSK